MLEKTKATKVSAIVAGLKITHLLSQYKQNNMLQTATKEHNNKKLQIIKKNHWKKTQSILGTGAFIYIHRYDQGIIAKKAQEYDFNISQKTTWREKSNKGYNVLSPKALIQTHCKYVCSSVNDEKGPDRYYFITPHFLHVSIYAYLHTYECAKA